MHILAIIQARMSSKRFPGKTLYRVKDRPMLQYLLERVECCNSINDIVVATSVEESDLPVEIFCQNYGVKCYRGSLNDVAGRFDDILTHYPCDAFVRVNGDSPLMDPKLIDDGVGLFCSGDYDLVTNVSPRSFPKGQSIEVLKSNIYRKAYSGMRDHEELEHVTRYYYNHPDRFTIHNFTSQVDYSNIQLSVDTCTDMVNFERIINCMDRPHWEYSWGDIMSLMKTVQID
ncbi:MAG TPA: hypothetical protein VN426_00125 [Syntrophomonadaceae bacterium]|nr:hypothetical protein [Syntrophomonadaceae bacterium]